MFISSLQISHEEAASQIGGFFPAISDKLLNVLQLYHLMPEKNHLVQASIDQKSHEIDDIPFEKAISYSSNRKYVLYLLIPFVIVIFLGLSFPKVIRESTGRIINHKMEYKPAAPFRFLLVNENLVAYKNEDFDLKLLIAGEVIPENVYLNLGERKIKLNSNNRKDYKYTFQKLSRDVSFSFEAAGFNSDNYTIEVVNRPNIKNFNVFLLYPEYLGKSQEILTNIGNLQIPEGTKVEWQFQTLFTDSMYMKFMNEETRHALEKNGEEIFQHNRQVKESQNYEISLNNQYTSNKDRIVYHLDVIPDEFPKISVNQFSDTVLYEFLILGGNVSDDHGFRDLRLYYRLVDDQDNDQDKKAWDRINLNIDAGKNSQSYYYNWKLDSFRLNSSDHIEYYLEVRDNDGINGSKASRTGVYHFRIPDREELKEELRKSSQTAENQIDKSLKKAQELNRKMDEIQDRLKGKKQMTWQEQKMLEDLIRDKQQLTEEIEQLQELNEANNMKQERFEEMDDELKEKLEQLQKLMDEMLDEESKKLFEELAKLLEEKKDLNDIKNVLKNMDLTEKNLERELERAMELFKRLKYENKLNEVIEEIKELENNQEQLANETQEKSSDLEDMKKQQENLNQDFKEFQESMEEMLDMNQDLEFPNRIENTIEEENNIEKQQSESMENLDKGNRNKATQSQKNAAQNMQKMSEKMESMKANGQMMQMQENFNDLRQIVDNLLTLSFTQEDIMEDFKSINQTDPRFIDLSQKQLKLKDDAQVIEDSLIALSKRVEMISSFVTREVSEMNKYMDESVESLRERKKAQATGKQQFAMTSMNNLALLLDDVLSMMQQQLANAMAIPQPGQQKQGDPSLSELQEQLNQETGELKKSGKTGKELSEELSRLASEQEKIRRRLQEEEKKLNELNGKQGSLGDISEKMEESEIDLVNKNLTQRLIQRQQEILTRLLEAEDAMREQELDPEREAKTAKEIQREIPPEFEKYLKTKEKETELLRTLPPKLNPYYKKEVMDYFNRLETTFK
ncbi:MAG: hypothetical protein KFF73_03780 [Cyclobacteriaceae bacterium]|nr:hypothetical protein [Cyclobacteriaceae bacterium]